jgi:hypothetical protein
VPVTVSSEFECWYDNGFAAAQWKADKKDNLVKDCTVELTPEKFILTKGKANVSCPWGGVSATYGASKGGNAILTITLRGEKGGAARIVLPHYSPAAFIAETWRVVPSKRPQLEQIKPEILAVSASASELLEYLGGYPLRPGKSDTGLWVMVHQFGITIQSGIRRHRETMIAWRDITAVTVEGMIDPQRQRSLARTVEFGVLGAGKQVKSSFLSITTAIGEAIFHSKRLTAPELRAKFGAVLPAAQAIIDARPQPTAQPFAQPAPAAPPLSVADELGKLAKLRADGVLTDEEFAAQKARLLNG